MINRSNSNVASQSSTSHGPWLRNQQPSSNNGGNNGEFRELFPSAYEIEFTRNFEQTFCEDPVAPPPAEVRQKFWLKMTGEPLFEARKAEAKREAERQNAEALRRYQIECERFQQRREQAKQHNASVQQHNATLREQYAAQRVAYHDTVAAHKQRYSEQRLVRFREWARKRLERTIDQQAPRLEAIHREALNQACLRTIHSGTCYLGVAALLAQFVLAAVFPLGTLVPAILAVRAWRLLLRRHTREIDERTAALFDASNFITYWVNKQARRPDAIYTPVHFMRAYNSPRGCAEGYREACPFPESPADNAGDLPASATLLACCLLTMVIFGGAPAAMLISVVTVKSTLWQLLAEDRRHRLDAAIERRRVTLLQRFDLEITRQQVIKFLRRRWKLPQHPKKARPLPMVSVPNDSPLKPAPIAERPSTMPEPPSFRQASKRDYVHTLRGTIVHHVDDIAEAACRDLFADDQVRPYFPFGGIPLAIREGQSPHILLMGTSGAGKTTLLRSLMSWLLPLSTSQMQRLLRRSPKRRTPSCPQEWSRSRTYQAVVYNAKSENIPFLASLGFDPDVDLLILDPADARCYAWDVAADIADRDSINQFSDLLVPVNGNAEASNQSDEFWRLQARRMIRAIVISLRNRALALGETPKWTLRDLARAAGTKETLAAVLAYHDTPDEIHDQLLDLDGPQASSIYLSATSYISQFQEVGERWDAAASQGRLISLKQWAKRRPHSVLVLPNTRHNPDVYGPLNGVFFKALTTIVLDDEYSSFIDSNGKRRKKTRYVFIDELGQAGKLGDLDRLMSEGRSFGVRVVLGLHQLSQLRLSYGTQLAETILGLCPNAALLKTGDPTTAEWESLRLGEAQTEHDRVSMANGTAKSTNDSTTQGTTITNSTGGTLTHSKGTTVGTSDTKGTADSKPAPSANGTGPTAQSNQSHTDSRSKMDQTSEGTNWGRSEAHSHSATHGTGTTESTTRTDSKEVRLDPAVLKSEFLHLDDPSATDHVAGYFLAPAYSPWKAEIPFPMLAPRLEQPDAEALTRGFVPWPDQEAVSKIKPWTADDYKRLHIDDPQLSKRKNSRRAGKDSDELLADFDF